MGRGRMWSEIFMSKLAAFEAMQEVLTILAIVLATAVDCTRQGKKLKTAEE